jgi:hypothetical protein
MSASVSGWAFSPATFSICSIMSKLQNVEYRTRNFKPQKSDHNRYFEIRYSLFDILQFKKHNHNCTPERQSLFESLRHRRRLTSEVMALSICVLRSLPAIFPG